MMETFNLQHRTFKERWRDVGRSVPRGHQHDALPGPQRVVERLVDVFQRILRAKHRAAARRPGRSAGNGRCETPDAGAGPCSGSAAPRPCASPRPSTSAGCSGSGRGECSSGFPPGIPAWLFLMAFTLVMKGVRSTSVCLPVGRGGVDDVQRLAEAELEAHRHHHAGGEQRGEQIALLERVDVAVQFLGTAAACRGFPGS